MTRAAVAALVIVSAAGATGCVAKESKKKKVDPAYIQANLLTAPPATIQNRVDADLGGLVTYLGNDVERATTRS